MREFDGLNYVFPTLTGNDVTNHRTVNAMNESQFLIGQPFRKSVAYSPNAFGVELGSVDHNSGSPTAFSNTIPHVVFLCAEKQVVGSYARRVVTSVKHFLASSKHNSMMKFVGKAVSQLFELLGGHLKDSIPFIVGRTGPNPASVLFVNVPQEQLVSGPDQRERVASMATKLGTALLNLIRICGKRTAASFTNASDLGSPEIVSTGRTTSGLLASDKRSLTVLTSAWYFLFGHGVTSLTGCKVSRLVRLRQQTCEPFCILA